MGLTVDAVPVALEPERVASVLSPILGDAVHVVEVRRLSAGASRLTWSLDVRSGGVLRRLVLQRERGKGLGRSEMLTEAALLRAKYKLETPDALQAATTIRSGATVLVTNDASFERIPAFKTVLFDRLL